MARRKNETSTKKSILILFAYLIVWWCCLTLFTMLVPITDESLLYYIVKFLRIGVPLLSLFIGAPIILIVGYDKNKRKRRKSLKSS